MDTRKYNLYSRIIGATVFFIASLTYLLTIEPTTSFWDCGEFIASSYKLEIGHPPGNPVFQLIARFFTIFASKENAAMAVNTMSALCSSLTILFLFLTIAHLGRRILEKNGKELNLTNSILLLGSAVVGSLAYCWSDTFWFSAVEAEVYAMSSLLTSIVFWAILKWEEQADEEYSNRWIILISLLMGLSIGVHLLNLLVIPAIAFIYYFKKYSSFTFIKGVYVFFISCIILGIILWGIIPYVPTMAAYVDLLFVNTFGLPFNSGAAFFFILLITSCFGGIYYTYKKEKVLVNTILLCLTMILVGFSSFAVIVIRSAANPPTNEYQPDNPFTLVRYLGREQYGSNPLIYGRTYASVATDIEYPKYYTPLGDKYIKTDGPIDVKYEAGSKMFFPRMWSSAMNTSHLNFYKQYTENRGTPIHGGTHLMPTAADNLKFFFNFQVNWMYIRYFMWNFAGRQNDHHSPAPGNLISGNWESGIGFIDKARLGNQSVGPDYLVNSKSKNHYYMLPLLLGIIGLIYHYKKDKNNWWVTTLLFFLTGIAIVIYLNQPPLQVRERDYAYSGSFYMFSIWIGLGVFSLFDLVSKLNKKLKVSSHILASSIVGVSLLVPIQMLSENWDDHNRSGRYTARDLAYNYLIGLDEDAILITHGDNDTFPLWYIQEVEEVRTDVRIMNTSLLGTDWYIDQMQYTINESPRLELTIPREQYLYGTNEFIDVINRFDRPISIKEAVTLFKDPRIKVNSLRKEVSYFPARILTLPVNKENVMKYGLVAPEDFHKIEDTLTLVIPENKSTLSKPELIILDYLSNYEWDRPIYTIAMGGDLEIGLRDYLQYDGFSYKFVPIKSKTNIIESGQVDSKNMYNNVMNLYKWESLAQENMNVDYQNLTTFNGVMSIRNIFVQTAKALFEDREIEKTIEVLDKMQEVMVTDNFPLVTSIIPSVNENMVLEAINLYLMCGEKEKGEDLALRLADEILDGIKLFAHPYRDGFISQNNFDSNYALYYYLSEDIIKDPEIKSKLKKLLDEEIKRLTNNI